MKKFIFHFKILSKAWHIYKDSVEIENDNYSDALNMALDNISDKYACPMNITLEWTDIKI